LLGDLRNHEIMQDRIQRLMCMMGFILDWLNGHPRRLTGLLPLLLAERTHLVWYELIATVVYAVQNVGQPDDLSRCAILFKFIIATIVAEFRNQDVGVVDRGGAAERAFNPLSQRANLLAVQAGQNGHPVPFGTMIYGWAGLSTADKTSRVAAFNAATGIPCPLTYVDVDTYQLHASQ
jgi:hypothetical protein